MCQEKVHCHPVSISKNSFVAIFIMLSSSIITIFYVYRLKVVKATKGCIIYIYIKQVGFWVISIPIMISSN